MHKLRFPVVLLLLFVLPAALIAAGVIPFSLRFAVLVLMLLFVIVYSALRGFSFADLGIRSDNLVASLGVNAALSALFSAVLFLLFYFRLIPGPYAPVWSVFIPFYFLFASPMQEFLFRSFLFAEMRASGIRRGWVMIAVSALSFSFIHVIYGDWLTLFATFCVGVMWGGVYFRFPNLAGVSLSHAIIGMFAILAGIARKM
ncbi:hypothetical protein CHL67_04390 [Prosthecochloris sp. GSB1]|uniref:CPBP family intramembrane glutamic endopeptidase n=1 Tax=Prosthecochloris sp. GSB1 TaxID=281093 RepID=UPI000B8C8B23|nr:CPBP family intramembrane glutamic endopeptidase [Prosthecochloris sp. GSB1]ASQ90262.1 hypothetical protein CHL67_04390 [Prosthecochloris sp. GSB1]